MINHLLWVVTCIFFVSGSACAATAVVKTNKGSFTIQLFSDKAPRSVSHFVELVKAGFYRDLKFHRVVPGLLIQGGDPKGDGSGGPGYCVDDEFHKDLKHDGPGIVSFTGDGPDSIGSQFAVTVAKVGRLDNRNSVFGRVTSGMEVVTAINNSKLHGSSPKPPVIIHDISIVGEFLSVPLQRRKELDEKAAVEVAGPEVTRLLQAVGMAQKLGTLKEATLKSVKSRCGEAQLYYDVSFQKFKKASLLVYGERQDKGFAIQQFQFSRGPS